MLKGRNLNIGGYRTWPAFKSRGLKSSSELACICYVLISTQIDQTSAGHYYWYDCNGVSYSIYSQICCGGVLFNYASYYEGACCGDIAYNWYQKTCCSGTIYDFYGWCCSGIAYDYNTHICCDGTIQAGSSCSSVGTTAAGTTAGGSSGGSLVYVCHPNGTIEVTNPNPGTFTDVMAVQNEGVSVATKCAISTTGSIALITGCSQDSAITVFFSDRTSGDDDLFVGQATQTFDIQCNDIAESGVIRTVSNLLGATLEVTTQDALTPSFTISSALRSGSQTGAEVFSAVIADTLYWTIDIPSDYHGRPTCTAYSGSSSTGSPDQALVIDGCNVYPDIVGGDFDNIDTSVPLVKRLWTTLYVFKFYNSDYIYIECSVLICPSSSSSCIVPCFRRKRSVEQPHNSSDVMFTTGRLLHVYGGTSAGPVLTGPMVLNAVLLSTVILVAY